MVPMREAWRGGGWVGELRLEVREFESLTRWRWAMTTPGGTLVADHGAMTRGDYRSASAAAGHLIMCLSSGRLAEALTLADQTIGYTRRAGLGPWTGARWWPRCDGCGRARPAGN